MLLLWSPLWLIWVLVRLHSGSTQWLRHNGSKSMIFFTTSDFAIEMHASSSDAPYVSQLGYYGAWVTLCRIPCYAIATPSHMKTSNSIVCVVQDPKTGVVDSTWSRAAFTMVYACVLRVCETHDFCMAPI